MVDRKIRKELIGRGHFAKNKFDDIVGDSRLISQTKQKAMRYAMSNSAVLIVGEPGVGKEMFAQSIHNYSNRKYKPFVAVNCAALPQSIMESELFGYVKGAFTGARSEGKLGIFELAHTGTVFLDEISELPLDVQAKLLRVIQEKELTRVGDDKTIPIDVRVIAACNTNLRECVSNKTFRQPAENAVSCHDGYHEEMDWQTAGLERDPRSTGYILCGSHAGVTGCIPACQRSR